MVLGFGWGIADEPAYHATSTGGRSHPSTARAPIPTLPERLAELGGSREVADAAAGLLGDDVPGADLLSDVEVVAAADGLVPERRRPRRSAGLRGRRRRRLRRGAHRSDCGRGRRAARSHPLIAGTSAPRCRAARARTAPRSSVLSSGSAPGCCSASLLAFALPRRARAAPLPRSRRRCERVTGPERRPRVRRSWLRSATRAAALRTIEPGVLALEDPAAEPLREAVEAPRPARARSPEGRGHRRRPTGAIAPALAATALGAAAAERGAAGPARRGGRRDAARSRPFDGSPRGARARRLPRRPRRAARGAAQPLRARPTAVEPLPARLRARRATGGGSEPDDLAGARMRGARRAASPRLRPGPAARIAARGRPGDGRARPRYVDGVVLVSSVAGSGRRAAVERARPPARFRCSGEVLIGE